MSVGAFISPYGDDPMGPSGPDVEDGLRLLSALSVITALHPAPAPTILWISRPARLLLRATYIVPGHVTLAFAPGAILTLGAGATLDIQGPIDIGSSGRFSLVGGRVILSGSLDAIHASWWVDESSGGAPLVHALAALWERYERSLDPAPILVTGPYLLEETVHIVPSESLSRSYTTPFDVVIRGRCRGSTAPLTFRASDSKAVGAMDALVAVDAALSTSMLS